MNIAIFSTSGTSSGAGFAIPSDTLAAIVTIIIEEGRVRSVSSGLTYMGGDRAKALGVSKGIVMEGVAPGSAASLAGLRGLKQPGTFSPVQFGDVIVAMNGTLINTEVDYLKRLTDGLWATQ